jgi:hypothetical protein
MFIMSVLMILLCLGFESLSEEQRLIDPSHARTSRRHGSEAAHMEAKTQESQPLQDETYS